MEDDISSHPYHHLALYVDPPPRYHQILPSLLFTLIQNAPISVQEPLTNLVFFCFAASLGYVVTAIAKREKPNQIPVISQAADMSIGPF